MRFKLNISILFIPLFYTSLPIVCLLAIFCTRQVIERKGLDMVRRDWSLLSKEIGDFCLSQILSGGYAFYCLWSAERR